jgi:hypothetical protein
MKGSNIAITTDQAAVVVGPLLASILTQLLPDGTLQENAFPTSLLAGFVDVAIDPTDEAKVFALSSFDGQACL